MQADSLQKLCETREERIQENKRKIEEARAVSREEATNFKEANERIQMLTSKVILHSSIAVEQTRDMNV